MSWFLNSKLVSIHADDSIVCSISFSTDVGKINIHILIMHGINYFDINYSLLEFAHIYSCKMATDISLLYALVRFPFQPLFRKMQIFFILTILMLMMQRVMRNYCKNEEKPLWHTHKVLWEKGSGRSTLSGKNCGQTSSQQLNITVLVVLGVIIPK